MFIASSRLAPPVAATFAVPSSHRPKAATYTATGGCPFGGDGGRPADTNASKQAARLARAVPREGADFAVFSRKDTSAQEVSFSELLDALCAPSDGPRAVLLGEVHDDAVTHKLQLQVLKHLEEHCRAQRRRLVLSLEMFETDVQDVLDEYVMHKAIREQDMLMDARPWGNYFEDYRPLVEFCRERHIRVIAANAPRRYVSLVAREGSAALEELTASRPLLPPLPLPEASAAYRRKFEETMSMPALQSKTGSCPFIGFSSDDMRQVKPEMIQAQQLWDHAMAQSVASALTSQDEEAGAKDGPPPLVLHICGAFHCAHGLGIPEALPKYWSGPAGSSPRPAAPEQIGPKLCPPGVVSVICWPAAVTPTLDLVRSGRIPGALGAMGDWVIITEETFQE